MTITVTRLVTHSIIIASHTFYHYCLDVLPFTASCNSYKPLMVSSSECVGIEVTLKYFAEDKGNKNNWPYPRCLEALKSIFEIGILFHMSRTSNIANMQNKWLQELLDIHFPEAGIIRGRDHQAQHIFYLPETTQTCPIDSLTHQGSQFSAKRILFCRACDEESACE